MPSSVTAHLPRSPWLALSIAGAICLFVFSSPTAVHAQVVFDHLSYRDGLVNSSISAILQDEDGFLWFGSQGGLHRYDGYSMRLFGSEPFDPKSLSHQLVQTLYYGDGSEIWIGTYGGLNRLNSDTFQIVERVRHDPDDPASLSNDIVVSIAHDAQGRLWVGTLDGLHSREPESELGSGQGFTRFRPAPDSPGELPNGTVRALHLDSRGRMWVGTLGGLSLVQEAPDGTQQFATIPGRLPAASSARLLRLAPELTLPHSYVMDITEDAAGDLWVGMWDGGVAQISAELDSIRSFHLPDNRVYKLLPASDGLLYIATWGGGLFVLDPQTEEVRRYRHDSGDPYSLAHDVVYSLFEDSSGIIWIGTNGNGISRLDRSRHDFRFIHPNLPAEQRLGTGRAHTLFYDQADSSLYVGVQEAGLHRRNPADGTITVYTHDPDDPNSISNNNVSRLIRDHEEYLLVATNAGVDRFYPDEGRFESIWPLFAELDENPPIVYGLLRALDNSLWLGTYDRGVMVLRPDGSLQRYAHDPASSSSLSNNLVYGIFQQSNGEIWVATNGGLNRYRPQSQDFERFTYDPRNPSGVTTNSMGHLMEDSAGNLWVGTRGGGLLRFVAETGEFRAYTYSDGLTSNFITGFQEAEAGVLYVATSNGLNRLDTSSGEVLQIDERDGLDVREFTMGVARNAQGELLFGAFSSVIRVPSRSDLREGAAPQVHITGIRVMNAVLEHEQPPHRIRSLTLPYTDNFLSFEFAAMEFSMPHRNRYRFQMVGLDSDWIDAGTRRFADYTGLPPGTYLFEVHAADARGNWSEVPARLEIHIAPPFWQTGGFVVLLAVLAVGLLYVVYQLRVRAFRLQNARLEAVVQERTNELHRLNEHLRESNATKDRFFSIVSHDLRGPIGGMRSFLRGLEPELETLGPEETQKYFRVLGETAGGIESMLENLLSWSRLQSGTMPVSPEKVLVSEVVSSVLDSYQVAIEAKNLSTDCTCDDAVQAWADPRALKTVLGNLVSNAVKFTPAGGSFSIAAEMQSDGWYAVRVQDSGVGIPSDKLENLFSVDRVVRTRGTAGEKGSGLGLSLCKDLVDRMNGRLLIESTQGKGTTVLVLLKPWTAGD